MEEILFTQRVEKLSIPLYKYFSNMDYVKDVIINKRIHFESPTTYNDIYDSRSYPKTSELLQCCSSGKTIVHIFSSFLSDSPHLETLKTTVFSLYENKETVYVSTLLSEICNQIPDFDVNGFLDTFRNQLSENNMIVSAAQRITCFSENKDSLLMWSYYADSHKGVCLEFDLRKDNLLHKNCHKVQYTRHFNKGNYNDEFFCKSEEWSHEQEWRIVQLYQDYMPTTSLTGVYVGCRTPLEIKNELFNLCIEYKLDLYHCKPSTKEYKLLFEKILKKGESIDSDKV